MGKFVVNLEVGKVYFAKAKVKHGFCYKWCIYTITSLSNDRIYRNVINCKRTSVGDRTPSSYPLFGPCSETEDTEKAFYDIKKITNGNFKYSSILYS